jgi:hypothetical protein
MDTSTELSEAFVLIKRSIGLVVQCNRPFKTEMTTKLHIAATNTERILLGDPQVVARASGAKIAERLSFFVAAMRRVETLLLHDSTRDAETIAALLHDGALLDRFLDDMEYLEANCIAAKLSEKADIEGEQFSSYFSYHCAALNGPLVRTASVLGEGSFGHTHSMKCALDDRTYAVKQVSLQRLAMMGITGGRLEDESAELRGLTHPNIARYFPSFYSGDHEKFNIVSELIGGWTLAEKIDATPAPAEVEITEWGRQMASALNYMHGQGVQHRDLRLDNVMLSARLRIKICDIKLACSVDFSAVFGRHADQLDVYSSHEKTNGLPYDIRDDVYAVGIILLSLLLRARYLTKYVVS